MKVLSVVILGGLALAGCTPDWATVDTSTVTFRIVDINGGAALQSDIRAGRNAVGADQVLVTTAVRPRNPNFNNVPQIAMAVFMERYTVTYYRSDGRNVEGVDVPFHISGDMTTVEDARLTGNASFFVEVVRAQAKLEPPLKNLGGPSPDTLNAGEILLTCFAEITIYGHTTAGQAVSTTGHLQIDFGDFPG